MAMSLPNNHLDELTAKVREPKNAPVSELMQKVIDAARASINIDPAAPIAKLEGMAEELRAASNDPVTYAKLLRKAETFANSVKNAAI